MTDSRTAAPAASRLAGLEVMISYAVHGRPSLARTIHDRLAEIGCVPRLDKRDLVEGQQWRPTIHGWLESCDLAVALLCPLAMRSEWVSFEVHVLAHRLQRDDPSLDGLLLVRLDGVELKPGGPLGDINSNLAFGSEVSDDDAADKIVAELERVASSAGFVPAPGSVRNRAWNHAERLLPSDISSLHSAAVEMHRCDPSIEGRCRIIPTDEAKLKQVVALELCRTEKPWNGLQELILARDPMEASALQLVDLNLCAFFDTRTCGTLAITPGHTAVVLACHSAGSAELAVRAALSAEGALNWKAVKVFLTNVSCQVDDVVPSIVLDLREQLARRYPGRDIDTLLMLRPDIDRHIIVIVTVPNEAIDLVDAEIPKRLRAALGPVVAMIFVGEDPVGLATRLDLRLVGPDHDVLPAYLAAADALLVQRATLRLTIGEECEARAG